MEILEFQRRFFFFLSLRLLLNMNLDKNNIYVSISSTENVYQWCKQSAFIENKKWIVVTISNYGKNLWREHTQKRKIFDNLNGFFFFFYQHLMLEVQ